MNEETLPYANEQKNNPLYKEVLEKMKEIGQTSARKAKSDEMADLMAMYASGELEEPRHCGLDQESTEGVTAVTAKIILPRENMKSAVTAVTLGEKEPVFWLENKSGKLVVALSEFVNWLEYKGFRQYRTEGESYSLVRVVGHIIEPYSSTMLANNLRSILFEGRAGMDMADSSHTWSEVYAVLVNAVGSVLEANRLSMIRSLDRPPLRDTRSRCYFPFRNCLVRVSAPPNAGKSPENQTPSGWTIDVSPYDKTQYLFFKEEIIDRNFSVIDE
ncbi:MAG: hypothetical protein PHV24_03945, partial [Candidatus Kapabacteria bacterium]|nr:hypothetical protein [Candidatus Kapabacteria bacterium]